MSSRDGLRGSLREGPTLCVDHLGEHIGTQVAELAKPGFGLRPVKPGVAAAGLSRWGGPALLNPGTPWPEYEGVPLSLFAVLDVDALGPLVGDERPPDGLLNIFFLDPDIQRGYVLANAPNFVFEDPRNCRIIPADPARAVEMTAPAPASVHDAEPFYAVPVVTLPSARGVDYDPVLDTLDYGGRPIGRYDMGDGGYLHFVLPSGAFRDGDYEQAVALCEGF